MKRNVLKTTIVPLIIVMLIFSTVTDLRAEDAETSINFEIFSVEMNYAVYHQTLSFDADMEIEDMFEQGFKTKPLYEHFDTTLRDDVEILSIENADGEVSVDFSVDILSTCYGSGAEKSMLRAIVNTVGNYFDARTVRITVEGEPYSGGHITDDTFIVEPYRVMVMESEVRVTADGGVVHHYRFNDEEVVLAPSDILLLVNGVFAPEYNVVIVDGVAYVPVELFYREYGIMVERAHIKSLNGKEYTPLRFIAERTGLSVGYLPSVHNGTGIAYNPVIWIDYRKEITEEQVELVTKDLKDALFAEFEKVKKIIAGTPQEKAFVSVYPFVSQIIENITYGDCIGRYAVFESLFTLLVDLDTGEIYLVYTEDNRMEIMKDSQDILERIWE